MRRCHVSLDVTLISRHCKPMLLLHGEQVEFPAPTKAELGLQNGHSPKVESFGEWWDIQDDCDHGTSSKPSQLRSERSRRTAADNLGAVFLEGRIEHLLRVYQKKWLKMIPMDRHILYLLSIWEWYIYIYIYIPCKTQHFDILRTPQIQMSHLETFTHSFAHLQALTTPKSLRGRVI